jgi:aminoglycoside phosphotransferase (APT) family kinase protein
MNPRFEAFLRDSIPGLRGPMRLRPIAGGQSNPTFFVDFDNRSMVLRKQPEANLLPSAHAIDREYRVMKALAGTGLALELMCERALERRAFGKYLADYSNVQDWIAESRLEIDQARLQTRVLDRAIQVFGAMGMTRDTPLAFLWTWGRAMHFVDGPDEVHLRVVARNELARAKAQAGSTAVYFTLPRVAGPLGARPETRP